MPLPPSPWQHDASYWVEDHSQQRRVADLHPLLGPHVEMLTGGEHMWQAELDVRTSTWLADQVQGQPVLSAAGIAEMMLSAGRAALGLPVDGIEVSDLQIEQPLAVDQPTRITTRFGPADGGHRVEIHAKTASGWRRHAVATVLATPGAVPAASTGPDATETDIALPDGVAGEGQYAIHPALLASALQALAGTLSADDGETVHLPTTLASIRVFGAVGRRARCRVQPGRILLLDDSGTPTAELSGIEFAAVDAGSLPASLDQMTFGTEWTESPLAAGQAAPGSWVLLADAGAETAALVAAFAARFESSTRRILTADLADEAAVTAAVADAAADPDLPAAGMIAFIGRNGFDSTDPDRTLRRSRELIVALSRAARAAAAGWQGNPARLWLVTRDGLSVRDGEPGDPTVGALRGVIRTWRFPGELARTLAEEPDLDATLVDLDGADDPAGVILNELAASARDDVIAHRGGIRYAERLTRSGPAAGDGPTEGATVRPDGAYVITGGLGGLGLVFARWLADRGAGRIVLSGRREPSADDQRRLDELGADGTEISYVRGDLAVDGVAQRLVAAAEETGKTLRGVLHSAGVLDESLVSAVTVDGLERVWAAKAAGAMRLHLATADRPLDWWVGFSSMAALLGLPGQLSYATANAWLDGFVAWQRAAGRPATAVSWGQWSDVGIGASMTLSVLDPISPAEGVDALQTLLGREPAHVGVARLRLDRALTATPEFRDLGYFEAVVADADSRRPVDQTATDDGDGSVAPVQDWSAMTGEEGATG